MLITWRATRRWNAWECIIDDKSFNIITPRKHDNTGVEKSLQTNYNSLQFKYLLLTTHESVHSVNNFYTNCFFDNSHGFLMEWCRRHDVALIDMPIPAIPSSCWICCIENVCNLPASMGLVCSSSTDFQWFFVRISLWMLDRCPPVGFPASNFLIDRRSHFWARTAILLKWMQLCVNFELMWCLHVKFVNGKRIG